LARPRTIAPTEERTARLTLLIDPRKKQVFERVCAEDDVTPSQVVRRLIRDYLETRLGRAWHEASKDPAGRSADSTPRPRTGRRP
jgi:Ribbon-helix-helix protein